MTERAEKAVRLRKEKGYNCSQGVVCAYSDLFGLDEETAYKISEGFGSGMGLTEVCGALSGAFILSGLKNSRIETPGKTKAKTYKDNKAMALEFKEKNQTYICRELKGVTDGIRKRSCSGCIEDACALIEKFLL